MTERISFTIKNLIAIDPPKEGRRVVYDTRVNGLCVSVTPKGTKSYQVYRKLNDKPLRVTLGRFPDLKIEEARRSAKTVLSKIARGINPIEEKRRQKISRITLSQVFCEYMSLRENQLSLNTKANYTTVMRKYFQDWLGIPFAEINRDMIQQRHAQITEFSPTSANKAMRIMRALFNFANGRYEDSEGRSIFPDNPVSRLTQTRTWNKETRRQRVIKSHQLPFLLDSLQNLTISDSQFNRTTARYLQFVLLNGLRRREASCLKKSDVDLADLSFRVSNTKNGNVLELPITRQSKVLLEECIENSPSDYVFPGVVPGKPLNDPRRVINTIKQQTGIDFSTHDLRRTFITIAESLDISAYAVKKLVNHSVSDVTAGYVVWDVERLRKPMQEIANKMFQLRGAPDARQAN